VAMGIGHFHPLATDDGVAQYNSGIIITIYDVVRSFQFVHLMVGWVGGVKNVLRFIRADESSPSGRRAEQPHAT